MIHSRFSFLFFLFCLLFLLSPEILAEELRSSNFRILEPVIFSSGFSTSSSFQLHGTISQIAIGTSTASSFQVGSGFLFFPFASSPVVTATAGNGQVELSWTASSGFLGWTVSGYNVGQSTTAAGPYTYSASLGNVTSSTRTGLTNGTAHYFVVRVEDAFGNSVATSSEVSATPTAPSPPPPPPAPAPASGGGGIVGGGGGGSAPTIPSQATKVVLKGRAYPGANLTVFKDGTTIATLKADSKGNFQAEVEVAGGLYTFSVYAIDSENRRSLTTSFTTNVPSGKITTLSDIVIAPTIGADKSQVKYGNDISFFGYAYPQSDINVIINSEEVITDKTKSDALGHWDYTLNSRLLEKGEHTTKSQIVTPDNLISPFSESLAFQVGEQDTAFGRVEERVREARPRAPRCSKNGDINNDGKINLIDFSIMLFFWNQRSPKNPCADINGDGIVDLFDFSIMLFWWTG